MGGGGLEARVRTKSACMFPVLWMSQSTHVCATWGGVKGGGVGVGARGIGVRAAPESCSNYNANKNSLNIRYIHITHYI